MDCGSPPHHCQEDSFNVMGTPFLQDRVRVLAHDKALHKIWPHQPPALPFLPPQPPRTASGPPNTSPTLCTHCPSSHRTANLCLFSTSSMSLRAPPQVSQGLLCWHIFGALAILCYRCLNALHFLLYLTAGSWRAVPCKSVHPPGLTLSLAQSRWSVNV